MMPRISKSSRLKCDASDAVSAAKNVNSELSEQGWQRAAWLGLAALFVASFAYAVIKVVPGYVHYDTGEAFFWSTLGFHLVYWKHPPLLPWIIGGFSFVVPASWISLAGLAAVNITVGAFATWRSALLMVGPRRAFLALLLFCLSPYTVWFAVKFDHNAILVSTWAVFIWRFFEAIRHPSRANGLWLGLIAALTLYAKYSSLIILMSAGVATLVSSDARAFWRTSTPYIAMIVAAVLVLPLAVALEEFDASSIDYALKVTPQSGFPAYMILASLTRQIPMLLAASIIWYVVGSWKLAPERHRRILQVLSILPFALTLLFTLVFHLRGSQGWMAPAFDAAPILLVSYLSEPDISLLRPFRRVFLCLCFLLVAGGVVAAWYAFRFKMHNETDPRTEIVHRAASLWKKSTGSDVPIMAGDMAMSFAATLALPNRPRSWANFNPTFWWIKADDVRDKGMVVLCREGDAACQETGADYVRAQGGFQCFLSDQRRRFGIDGPLVSMNAFFVAPAGRKIQSSCVE